MAREYDPQLAEMGARIVARREELGMTATELAIYIDVTPATLSRIESGQCAARTDTLLRIAFALKVSLAYFQPHALDDYSGIPAELLSIMPKLTKKTALEKRKIVQMLTAMIDIM